MNNSEQEKQDQRTNSSMEDSPAMCIEFLRARLLSERSVSKSARQRADELARRVAELEEQLKMVCLQRKKAEKATADVLAILENNGISDISEAFDSSSDQETPCESKVGNSSNRDEEDSVSPKLRRNEWEELSALDIDFSPGHQRGLSWKGSKETSHSSEKYKDNYMRRRSSFGSFGSSPKHRVGKSCRQNRRRDSKSVVEELKTDPIKGDSQENGAATSVKVPLNHSDGRPEILREGSEAQQEKPLPEVSHSGFLENEKTVTSGDVNFDGHEEEKNLEEALEHQAQLIGKYEEMEKAQIEWEERFRENNSSSPDSYDPGNQSDVTEEREETKAQVEYPAAIINTVQETKSEDVCFSNKVPNTQSNGLLPPSNGNGDVECLSDQKFSFIPASESLAQDFAFPMANGKQIQESLKNDHCSPSHNSHHHTNPHPHGSSGNHSATVVSSSTGSSFATGKVSGSQNELYALLPHEKPNGFNEVLEALRQAKLSLQQGVSRVPLRESKSVENAIELSVPATKVWDRVDSPVGWAGLFRLPTDYAVEESRTFLTSSSQSKLGNYYPHNGLGVTVGDGILTNSYMDNRSAASAGHFLTAGDKIVPRPSMDGRSNYSTDDRLFTSQYSAISSKIPTQKPSFDGNFDAGLPSSRQYAYTSISSSPDLMPWIHNNDRFSTFPSRSAGMPPSNLDAGLSSSSPYTTFPSRSVGMPPSKLDAGLSSSRPYTYPAFSSNLEPVPRVPTGEGFPTLRPSRSVGMPPAAHLSLYGDHTRPNIYT